MKQENIKVYLLSLGIILVSVLLVVSLINGVSIGNMRILSLKEITSKEAEVKLAQTNLELEKTKYDILNQKLEEEKKNFKEEKAKYEAISDETVDIINKINTKEKYSIEYIWIKLGNYAEDNNLSITLKEPSTDTTSDESSMFKIEVSGSYINVATFIYDIENDSELKFKLDNINMEYVSSVNIKATFSVNNIVIIK